MDPEDETTLVEPQDVTTRSRGWCFVINNYTEDDKAAVARLIPEGAQYLICGYEVGKKTGTPHLQGYVYYTNQRSFKTMKERIERGWLAPARGTGKQNQKYCSKEGNLFLEIGEVPEQGKRVDLAEVYSLLESGGTYEQVVDLKVNAQCLAAAREYLKVKEPVRNFKTVVHWKWGEPGTGKSRDAEEESGGVCYSPPPTSMGKFWDGYDAHETVVLDDLEPGDIPYRVLLKLLDRYAYRVETKGSTRQMLARTIYVCTEDPPEAFVPRSRDGRRRDPYALMRRLDTVTRYEREPEAEKDLYQPKRLVKTIRSDGSSTIVDAPVQDAARGKDGGEAGSVQEETSDSPGHAFKNFKPGNNLGVRVTPDNGSEPSRSRTRKTKEERYKERCLPIWSYAGQDQGYEGGEAIAFPQTPSLCSVESDDVDGVYQQEHDATPDDPGSEDSDADQGEP